ncbi:hypothetical protein L484_021971 [Morus notabilis]|uniref:Uncharacterized protein n=1 Tax=Morus notabilis TaxID=981085 RepID=W9QUY4_9ROSA|nr:hypothetical protein L484_021971 [Morus notabilis]
MAKNIWFGLVSHRRCSDGEREKKVAPVSDGGERMMMAVVEEKRQKWRPSNLLEERKRKMRTAEGEKRKTKLG